MNYFDGVAQISASNTALSSGGPERGRLTLRETFSDSKVMAARQLRKILRRPIVQLRTGAPEEALVEGGRASRGEADALM